MFVLHCVPLEKKKNVLVHVSHKYLVLQRLSFTNDDFAKQDANMQDNILSI